MEGQHGDDDVGSPDVLGRGGGVVRAKKGRGRGCGYSVRES